MKELSDISAPLEQEPAKKPGVYRSRVFSFIHQQASRLRHGVGQSWRQVKVSAQWTGEILFAPLRWLNRFKQDLNPQLTGRNLQKLPPAPIKPRVEIEQLLAEVVAAGYGELQQVPAQEDWSVIDERDWDTGLLQANQLALRGESASLTARKPVIRGLACALEDRSLVLIDQHNQILDVLSPSQQLHLQRQIDPAGLWSITGTEANFELSGMANLALQPATIQYRLPPAPLSNPWQQAIYWFQFYRDYLKIDDLSKPAGELMVRSPGVMTKKAAVQDTALTKSTPVGSELATEDSDYYGLTLRQIPAAISEKKNKTVFKPEWIEAPVDDLGYHRSLFVQLLEWLDRLMLAIENWLLRIYRRLFAAHRE
jgi:hypothetical protein